MNKSIERAIKLSENNSAITFDTWSKGIYEVDEYPMHLSMTCTPSSVVRRSGNFGVVGYCSLTIIDRGGKAYIVPMGQSVGHHLSKLKLTSGDVKEVVRLECYDSELSANRYIRRYVRVYTDRLGMVGRLKTIIRSFVDSINNLVNERI